MEAMSLLFLDTYIHNFFQLESFKNIAKMQKQKSVEEDKR